MNALRAPLAFVMLALLVTGVPILLLAWGDPLSLVDVSWSTALVRPDDGTILLGVLSVLGWLAWVVVTVTTTTELISLLSHRRVRIHLPGISWLQPAMGSLLAVALSPVLSSQADEPPPSPASHAPRNVEPLEESPAPRMAAPSSPTRDFVIQPGDELWTVAERELGNGADWRSIIACNPGMTANSTLKPGDVIRLPALVRQSPMVRAAETTHVTVERGDTLWDLAQEHLGDPFRWPEIFDANRDVVTDPDEIDIGWHLVLPTNVTETAAIEDSVDPDDRTIPTDTEDGNEPHEAVASADDALPEPPSLSPPPSRSSTDASDTGSGEVVTADDRIDAPISPMSTPAPSSTDTATTNPVPIGSELREGDSGSSLEVLGLVGGALAASIVAGVAGRRHLQLLQRGIGRRLIPITPSLQRFFSALVQRSQSAPGEPPASPGASIVLGWDDDGDVTLNLERARCTLVAGSDEHTASMAAAMLTSLLCADWSAGVEVVAVQPDQQWGDALDDPRLTSHDELEKALVHLQRLCAERRLQLAHDSLADVRSDPDRADAWVPVVFLFCTPLAQSRVARILDCLSLGPVGVSVVVASQPSVETSPHTSVIHIESETRARLNDGTDFQPQLLSQPARRAVMSLFASALDGRTTPAPWWRAGEDAVVTVPPTTSTGPFKDGAMSAWPTHPENPTLLLLGSVELLGASGEPPARASSQCIEYCAWLLLHPGASPTTMVRELLVAETTRRSNMSRLRTWLGADKEGNPYLPDAYSGRISLAPSVTSDWERFQSLLAGGVNTSSTPLLHEALSLVRGRPLDGVAFQWPWTSGWLTDMTSMISDAATSLADRYLTQGDCPGALWAINQGQLATGDDEVLAVRRIQVLAQLGDSAEVDAAVTHLTRAARATNRELSADSIRRIQQALHLNMQRATSS